MKTEEQSTNITEQNDTRYQEYGNVFKEDNEEYETTNMEEEHKGRKASIFIVSAAVVCLICLLIGIIYLGVSIHRVSQSAKENEEDIITVNALQNLRVTISSKTKLNGFTILILEPYGDTISKPIENFIENYNKWAKSYEEDILKENIQKTAKSDEFLSKYPKWCSALGDAIVADYDSFQKIEFNSFVTSSLEVAGYDCKELSKGTYRLNVDKEHPVYHQELSYDDVIKMYFHELTFRDTLSFPDEVNLNKCSIMAVIDYETAEILTTMEPYTYLYVTIVKEQPLYRYHFVTPDGKAIQNITLEEANDYVQSQKSTEKVIADYVSICEICDEDRYIQFSSKTSKDDTVYEYQATSQEEYDYLMDYYIASDKSEYFYTFCCIEESKDKRIYKIVSWEDNPYVNRLNDIINEITPETETQVELEIESSIDSSSLINEAIDLYESIPDETKETVLDAVKDLYNSLSEEEKQELYDNSLKLFSQFIQ